MPRKSKKLRNARRNLQGSGGFFEDVASGFNRARNWSKGAGKKWMNIGRAAADAVLPGSGAVLKQATDLLGFGAYNVRANSILASPVPTVHALRDKGIRVVNKEFIGDLSSAVNFTNTPIAINPGMSACFPWLSQIAASFQKYEIRGLVFYFNSTSATALNSTNTALGTVAGMIQYNPYATAPGNMTDVLSYAGSQSAKPSESMIYPLECARDLTTQVNRLVRTGAVGDDLGKYDAGIFNFAAVGSQAASTVGQLWVSYDIVLKEPRRVLPGWTATYRLSGVDNTHPLGTSQTMENDGIGLTFAGNSVSLPANWVGKFLFVYNVKGLSAAITAPVTTLVGAVTLPLFDNGSSAGFLAPSNGDSAQSFTSQLACTKSATNVVATVTYGTAGTLPGTPSSAQLMVIQLQDDIVG